VFKIVTLIESRLLSSGLWITSPLARGKLQMKMMKANKNFLFFMGMVLNAQAWAQVSSEGDPSPPIEKSADKNPSPPSIEPGMKRVRAIPFHGNSAPRAEKTGELSGASKSEKSVRAESVFEHTEPVRKPQWQSPRASAYAVRKVFLNGTNISSLRGETLDNVQVRIDEQGDIHLLAPHYEVSEESSYHPLLPRELPRYSKQRHAENLPFDPSLRVQKQPAEDSEPVAPVPQPEVPAQPLEAEKGVKLSLPANDDGTAAKAKPAQNEFPSQAR
jgi:nucleoid-associated protein YgaU